MSRSLHASARETHTPHLARTRTRACTPPRAAAAPAPTRLQGVEKVLRFLGVDEAHRNSCVHLCRASDISRTRSDDGLATCLKGKPGVQKTLDELRAKLEPRAPANDTDAKLEVIDQPGWYNKYVTPIEKATPIECAGSDHEFEPALEPLKEQLDGVLRASTFFKQRVEPLRRAMGYHD